ncbi:MAG: hypothetical protein IJF24_02600 [Clostridia bacterium]|nr:hypothetical protein [Clostridia bacterium]
MKRICLWMLSLLLLLLCACQSTLTPQAPTDPPPADEVQTETPEQNEDPQEPQQDDEKKKEDEKEETVEYKSEYEKIEALSEKDPRYRWIKLFLDRDSEGCANFLRDSFPQANGEREEQFDEWFAPLKTLTFGEYSVTEVTREHEYGEYSALIFEFEVIESSFDTFPVGTYAYEVIHGRMAPASWHKEDRLEIQNEDAATLFHFVSSHIYSAAATKEPTESAKIGIFDAVKYFYRENGGELGKIPKEELQNGALAIFGVENFVPNDYEATLTDGVYHAIGHGGFSPSHEILEVKEDQNKVVVTAQFYADIMNLSKSHLVRYTIELTDGDYPVRLASVERLEDGVWDPYVWMA